MNPHTINVWVYGVMTNSLDRDHIGHEVYVPVVGKWLPINRIEHRAADVVITTQCGPCDIVTSFGYDSPVNLRVPAGPEPKDRP